MAKQRLKEVKDKVEVIRKKGGFKILKSIIDNSKGIHFLDPGQGKEVNPADEAKREVFLTDDHGAEQRKKLKTELEILLNLIDSEDSIKEAEERDKEISTKLENNLKKVFESTKELEKSYRCLSLFFKNSGQNRMDNLYIMNIPIEEFAGVDNDELRDTLDDHFDNVHDRFALSNVYSMLVIPGFLGNSLDEWGQMAAKYKLMLVTDFSDEDNFEAVKLRGGEIRGQRMYHANTLVTCNHGVARKKYEGVEYEDLFVPMSAAFAGKLYKMNGTQPPAGKRDGEIIGVLGTRIDLRRKQVDAIDQMGMIPIIYEKEWGTVAMSDTTRFIDAEDPEFRALAAVKVKDWIGKVLLNYFNLLTFQNFDGSNREKIENQLKKFFNQLKGNKVIKSYDIGDIVTDEDNSQAVYVPIQVTFHTATKHYLIDFIGENGTFSIRNKGENASEP